MGNLDLIEAASGGPFRFLHEGQTYTVADPADSPFQIVLLALHDQHVPGAPRMPEWKRALLFERWSAHHDLPDFLSAQRLAYLFDRYRSAIVYDLQAHCGVDAGELWRSRRWRTALDLIDHLPGHSWYSAAVADDEEHAEMIAESLAAREAEGEKSNDGPPLNTWTPELAELRGLRDDLRRLWYIIPASAGDKKVQPEKPLPRPITPLERALRRAKHEQRREAHETLVKRLLPHKR